MEIDVKCDVYNRTPIGKMYMGSFTTQVKETVDNCKDVCKEPAKARKVQDLPPISGTQRFTFTFLTFEFDCVANFVQKLTLYQCEPKPGLKLPKDVQKER